MCGILGYLGPGDKSLEGAFEASLDSMAARGPDDFGIHSEELGDESLCLGHRRLAILDLSPGGHQPMVSNRTNRILLFNGEIYNYKELRVLLEQRGFRFHSDSDSEVLLASYDAWGITCLERLNGMFAFSIWDPQERSLFIARDRLGIKPLYYSTQNATIAWGSQLLPLTKLPNLNVELDPERLNDYFGFGYFPWDSTPLKGFNKLPPGHYAIYEASPQNLTVTPYWSANDSTTVNENVSAEEAKHEVHKLLEKAVKRRLLSDVPLGAFLSGGIDSSLVASLASANSSTKLKTFTIGFSVADKDEAPYAKEIAKYLGSDHHELYITPSHLLDSFEEIVSMYDEPFVDSSLIPTLILAKFAKEHVTVGLSGDGGDETHFGYGHYQKSAKWHKFSQNPQLFRKAIQLGFRLSRNPQLNRWSGFLLKENIAEFMIHQIGDTRSGLVGDIEKTMGATRMRQLFEDFQGEAPAYPLVADISQFLPDDLLVKTDRASMAHSLEVRVPLLDHEHVEYSMGLPLSIRCPNYNGKHILKSILEDYIPRPLWERPKKGFSVPLNEWFRQDLSNWSKEQLAGDTSWSNGFVDPPTIERLQTEHMNKQFNNARQLWALIILKNWIKRLEK